MDLVDFNLEDYPIWSVEPDSFDLTWSFSPSYIRPDAFINLPPGSGAECTVPAALSNEESQAFYQAEFLDPTTQCVTLNTCSEARIMHAADHVEPLALALQGPSAKRQRICDDLGLVPLVGNTVEQQYHHKLPGISQLNVSREAGDEMSTTPITPGTAPASSFRKRNDMILPKRASKLPIEAVTVLDDWFSSHKLNPYPSREEFSMLTERSGLSKKQVQTWLSNARRRQLDPMSAWLSGSSEDEGASIKNIAAEAMSRPTWEPPNVSRPTQTPSCAGSFDSGSSAGSAFDTCPEARRSGPRKQGRKTYRIPSLVRSGSISSTDGHSPKIGGLPSSRTVPTASRARFKQKGRTPKHNCRSCGRKFWQLSALEAHINFSHSVPIELPRLPEATIPLTVSTAPSLESSYNHLASPYIESSPNQIAKPSDQIRCRVCVQPIVMDDSIRGLINPSWGLICAPCDTDLSRFLGGPPVDDGLLEPVRDSPAQPTAAATAVNSFECTFCRAKLAPRAWKRHEETQHLPRWQWFCMPQGHSKAFGACAFCGARGPSGCSESCEKHYRVHECLKRDLNMRTFGRKDHLIQHIKQYHKHSEFDVQTIEQWGSKPVAYDRWWDCGFCEEKMNGWNARCEHIARHFRDGLTMDSWRSPDVEGA